MAIIQINNLSFTHESAHLPVFNDISLQLDSNWKIGLIGRNGRGKTTFLDILMDRLPYEGNIISPEFFKYFPYEITNPDILCRHIAEIYEPSGEIWMVEKELALLQLDTEILNRPFSSLSMGEKTKLQLAMLFSVPGFFLLIDEPTNHLDISGRRELAHYLQPKEGYILASHDRNLLDESVNYILSINKETIDIEKGNYTSWKENFDRQNLFEAKKQAILTTDIKRLEKAQGQTATWSDQIEKSKYRQAGGEKIADRGFLGRKAADIMKKSKVLERRQDRHLEEKKGLLKNMETASTIFFHNRDHHQTIYGDFRDFHAYYEEGKPLHQRFYKTLEKGDRLFVQGANGAGKTTIIQLMLSKSHANIQYQGVFHMDEQIDISYVPQDTSFLLGSIDDFIFTHGLDKTLFLTLLRKMGLEREVFLRPIETFSHGQQKKLLLAKSLSEEKELYIWDEPLNFLDIETRIQLEKAILFSKPTMIIIEHDRTFQKNVATKILQLEKIE